MPNKDLLPGSGEESVVLRDEARVAAARILRWASSQDPASREGQAKLRRHLNWIRYGR